jgi:hypothetical protein
MVAVLAMVAFAVDVGYLLVARTELQRSADAAALAATWEFAKTGEPDLLTQKARSAASRFAALNVVTGDSLTLDRNTANRQEGDIVAGTLEDPSNPEVLDTSDPALYNAVRVRVRKTGDQNGEVPLFFARVFGWKSVATSAEATAVVMRKISGIRMANPDEQLPFLPITLEEETWNRVLSGEMTSDNWAWDPDSQTVAAGTDDIPEAMLFPERNDSPGNFGTLSIGADSNSTQHLSAQIRDGLSNSDLDYHGGELKLGDDGTLELGGDTGISDAIKDDLTAIIGQPRMMPIYRRVVGQGNTAVYTIVKFVGIRVMAVQLTGADKALIIQPADVVTPGVIPAETDNTSDFVYSPVFLVK